MLKSERESMEAFDSDAIKAIEANKATPTPSITVGTQVRLTGVVLRAWPEGGFEVVVDGAPDMRINIRAKHLEVIRQPFKRGEVVYLKSNPTNEIPCRILEDEDAYDKGVVLLVGEYVGARAEYAEVGIYERRP